VALGHYKTMLILKELFEFMKENKKWWIAPIVVTLLLLGTLIAVTQGTVVAPFVYTLF
jgi:hypothetical protein